MNAPTGLPRPGQTFTLGRRVPATCEDVKPERCKASFKALDAKPMTNHALLLSLVLSASPHESLVDAMRIDSRLLQGDTAVLIALAGEEACRGSHDPSDCEATRAELTVERPMLLLADFDGVALPPLAGEPASLLLPTFPYGLDEDVNPSIGHEPGTQPSEREQVRIFVPDDTEYTPGLGVVSMLVEPAEASVLESPSRPWVFLDILPRSLVIRVRDSRTGSWEWTGATGPATRSLLPPEPEQLDALRPALEPALSLCARDAKGRVHGWYRRLRKAKPLRGEPLLAIAITPEGFIADVALLDQRWDDSDLDTCVSANVRALGPLPARSQATVGLLRVLVDSEAGLPDPSTTKGR